MSARLGPLALLFIMGAGWGATMPLSKLAVSGGYRSFGIVFWQLVIGMVLLGGWLVLTRGLRPLGRSQAGFAAFIALVGTILPNGASFAAVVHLPAGIMAIVIAAVPMIAFPMALALGIDRFSVPRLLGLTLGIGGVALLARPESLPDAASAAWVAVALIAPTLYAVEANAVARLGTFGLDAVSVLFWASVIGAVITLPLALASGTFIPPRPPTSWGAPDWAIIAASGVHAIVYASYVWLLGRAGAVFAGQVGYLVTGFGVVWSILFLGESYPGTAWLALGLVLSGVFLVQPRSAAEVAGPR